MKKIEKASLKLFILGCIGLAIIQINVNDRVNAYVGPATIPAIYTSLKENGTSVALYNGETNIDGKILKNLINREQGEVFLPGKEYQRAFYLENTKIDGKSGIDQYVRVVIYKYWQDEENEMSNVPINLINLNLGQDNWLKVDENDVKVVLLYSKPLGPEGTTTNFINGFRIDPNIKNQIEVITKTTEDNNKIVTIDKKYQKVKPYIEINVDAIQADNIKASDIKDMWNIDVEIESDKSLSLI